jgi:hypothetical protein
VSCARSWAGAVGRKGTNLTCGSWGVRERGELGGLGWSSSRVGLVAALFFLVLLHFLFYDLFHNSIIWIPNAFFKQVSKFL